MIYVLAAALLLAASTHCSSVSAQQVEFNLEDTLTIGETDVPYRLDLVMSAVAQTRIGVEALLDLRVLQKNLPDIVSGEPISDDCGSRTELTELAVEAEDDVVSVTGLIDAKFFECERTSETGFQRGAPTDQLKMGFSAAASALLREKCITFELVDVAVNPLQQVEDRALSEDLQAVRVILLEVAGRFLEERPLCLSELPPELASLDPVYESGGPREIGDGGLGVYVSGSIDVTTTTILEILRVLQSEEVIPGPP
jgi:hypothetical protein